MKLFKKFLLGSLSILSGLFVLASCDFPGAKTDPSTNETPDISVPTNKPLDETEIVNNFNNSLSSLNITTDFIDETVNSLLTFVSSYDVNKIIDGLNIPNTFVSGVAYDAEGNELTEKYGEELVYLYQKDKTIYLSSEVTNEDDFRLAKLDLNQLSGFIPAISNKNFSTVDYILGLINNPQLTKESINAILAAIKLDDKSFTYNDGYFVLNKKVVFDFLRQFNQDIETTIENLKIDFTFKVAYDGYTFNGFDLVLTQPAGNSMVNIKMNLTIERVGILAKGFTLTFVNDVPINETNTNHIEFALSSDLTGISLKCSLVNDNFDFKAELSLNKDGLKVDVDYKPYKQTIIVHAVVSSSKIEAQVKYLDKDFAKVDATIEKNWIKSGVVEFYNNIWDSDIKKIVFNISSGDSVVIPDKLSSKEATAYDILEFIMTK